MLLTKLNKKGKLIMDVRNNKLYLKGESVFLTEKEKRLLHLLMVNQGRIVGHTEIRNTVWPERSTVIVSNNILQLIFRLRVKFKLLGVDDGIITIPGKGYKLDVLICIKKDKCSFKSREIVQSYNFRYYIILGLILIISKISLTFIARML